MVKYQVQFKPINTANNSPITNTSAWSGVGSSTAAGDYDCALYYTRTSWPTDSDSIWRYNGWVPAANFRKIPHSVWAVFSVADTIKQAMKIAKPLMQQYGVDNVQIVQVVPASTEIVFEEQ